MRKILSGFLATAMVASVCATMTFAVEKTVATKSYIEVDLSGIALEKTQTDGTGFTGGSSEALSDDAKLTLEFSGGGELVMTVAKANITRDLTAGQIANQFAALTSGTAGTVSKYGFDGTPKDAAGNDLAIESITSSGSTLKIVLNQATGSKSAPEIVGKSLTPSTDTSTTMEFSKTAITTKVVKGEDSTAITVDAEGDLLKKFSLDQVILTKPNGDPRALTEKTSGVDKDQNGGDGIQSGKTLYFMVQPSDYRFDDDTYWKLKITKGDNGKYIKAISDVSKTFSNNLYDVVTGEEIKGTGGARHRYIKVELNEIYTDDEYKITLDLRLSPKSKATNVYTDIKDGDEVKVSDFYFYMKNIVRGADNDWKVGINGLMLEPLENDWNNITWFDEDGDLAHLKFFADSDVGKFYSKLSTKWEHADYASYFNDQDAFTFQFTGAPKLSATSRADLEIYNPFVDEDGNETIDPATAVIYQVIDGDLFDITDSFSYEEGNNGDMAFTTRTRFLGTYIICEKPVEEAVDNTADVPTDLVPEDTTPSEVTPDNNGGGKAPANTGKYL